MCASKLFPRLGLIVCVLGGNFASSSAKGQEIASLREDVRTNSPPAPTGGGGSSGSQSSDAYDEQDDSWSTLEDGLFSNGALGLGALTGMAITAPFWGPAALLGDSLGTPGYFPTYPYEHNAGYMLTSQVAILGAEAPPRYVWAWRGRAEYGTNFDGLEWTGGGLLLETAVRFGLDAELRNYREQLPRIPNDEIWLGDCNLHYRIAQSEWIQVRAGLGMNYLADAGQVDLGFNFTYSADLYLCQPFVVSAEVDWGTLGHSSLIHARLTAGMQLGPAEGYVGYDLYDIGPFDAGGMTAGLRLWF